MEQELFLELKNTFQNDQKYNQCYLEECSIYENLLTIYFEIVNYENKELFQNELELLYKFFNTYNKFSKYEFCKSHFKSKYEIEGTKTYLKDSNLLNLFLSLYDKFNLMIDDFMGIVEYNHNRVSFNNKTSVFLIAYASELKDIWDCFNEKFIDSFENKNVFDKIYREEFIREKLKYTPPVSAKGAWAKGPLNIVAKK